MSGGGAIVLARNKIKLQSKAFNLIFVNFMVGNFSRISSEANLNEQSWKADFRGDKMIKSLQEEKLVIAVQKLCH